MTLPSSPTDFPKWKKNLPMTLTWARIGVCPFLIFFMMIGKEWADEVAAGLFIAASITDWFDGYYARKFNAITNLGKFMDPIADKILVAGALIMMTGLGRLGPVVVILLLVRDILIGGIRAVAAADHVIIDAKSAGKWKTGLQMVSIPAMMIAEPGRGDWAVQIYHLGFILLWVSVILSIVSGAQYVRIYQMSKKRV
jgi:CDP-diacylglycerol--glycerol-3-phosphate 3-phosphatidyltransferase